MCTYAVMATGVCISVSTIHTCQYTSSCMQTLVFGAEHVKTAQAGRQAGIVGWSKIMIYRRCLGGDFSFPVFSHK